MTLYAVGGLIFVGSFNFLLGLAVFSRDIKKKTNIFFLVLNVFLAIWSFGIAAFLYTDNLEHAALYANLYYIAAFGIAESVVAFGRYRTVEHPPRRFLALLVFLLLAYCLLITIFPNLILKEIFITDGQKNVSFNVAGQAVYSILFSTLFVGAIANLFRSLKHETLNRRSQTKYIIAGLVSAGVIGMTSNLVMPWFGLYGQIWVGPLFTLLFSGFIVYAIAKHKLFDFRRTVARAVGYLVTLGSLTLLYLAVLFVLSATLFSGQSISLGQRLFFIGFTLFAAVVFQPLKKFFDHTTNQFFYHDAYDPQVFLDRLNTELVANIELEVLLRRTCSIIQSSLRCESCLVITRETDSAPLRVFAGDKIIITDEDVNYLGVEMPKFGNRSVITDDLDQSHARIKAVLSANNMAIVAPVFPGTTGGHKRALAYLILGPKKSGNMYTKEDLRIVDIISDELVIAIQNALRFEEIQGFAATLQTKVNEATSELKAANQKLKELDASKDEFISMASHQLRTPLTSVKGYLSMVLEGDAGKLTAMQRKLLTQSFNSSQRMVYLIADLLNVSRLKTGKFVIAAVPTNLAEVVESEITQLTETAAARNLSLVYNKPAAFPTLMLDETKIRQVIMNFIDNAIYYTPAGGKIEVVLQDNDQSVELKVVDNGLGVPKHEQHHLFTKFYRAGNARNARPDGTGLGLFMAKKVIIAQGGSLIFSSTEGKGSTFGFTFAKAKLLAPDTLVQKT